MKLLKYIIFILLLVSLLTNVLQQSRLSYRYLPEEIHVELDYQFDIPEFTEREKSLIRKAAPTLVNHSSLLVDRYIGGIEETEDEIIFYIFSLSYLRSVSISLEEQLHSTSFPMDAEGPTMVFDKNMNLKKLIPMWGEEVVFKDGKPIEIEK